MKHFFNSIASIVLFSASALALNAHATVVSNTVESPSAFFIPLDAQKAVPPYQRFKNEDWSWSHTAISDSFTSAYFSVSAFDVDFAEGERDNIYAYDASGGSGVWVLLGALNGSDESYAYTTFSLGSMFFDDIQSGLQMKMDIDATNLGWGGVSLAKSVVSLDSLVLPPPEPGATAIPEPGTLTLLALGLIGMAFVKGRKA